MAINSVKSMFEGAKQEIQKSQQIWLKSWGPSCTFNNEIDVVCARRAYERRINVLKSTKAKTIHGMPVVQISVDYFRPYTKEEYESDEYWRWKGSELDVNYSVVNNPTNSPLISALNEWLLPSSSEFNTEHQGSDGSVSIDVFEVSKNIVGRSYGMSDFGHGAHPATVGMCKYFLPTKGRPLVPSDIFIDPKWSSRIARYFRVKKCRAILMYLPLKVENMITTTDSGTEVYSLTLMPMMWDTW